MNTNYLPQQNEKFDVVVIGAGPAGERGAAQAAYFGKKVLLIEREAKPGGACVNTGTLPSKTFRETALHLSGLASRGIAGVTFDMKSTLAATQLRHRYAMVAYSEHRRIQANIERHKIFYLHGNAEFEDKNTIVVKDKAGRTIHRVKTDFVMIATGTSPHRPPEVPFDDVTVMDSDSVLGISVIPKSLTVVGAGVIGSEYASIFAALGVKVHLVDSRETLLPFLDSEISRVLKMKCRNSESNSISMRPS